MAVTLTIKKNRALAEVFGNELVRHADVTIDIGGAEASYALVAADLDALGLRRVHQILGPTLARDATGGVAIGVSWEISTAGVPTLYFWESGAGNAPLAANNSNYTGANAPTVRLTFLGT